MCCWQSLDRPVAFAASKDRPILFTALAWSHILLTLDREDFANFLGGEFYGLRVRLPFDFLEEERAAGRLKISRPQQEKSEKKRSSETDSIKR